MGDAASSASALTRSVRAACRRHLSLLRSLASDGRTLIPVHTILEVYRVADMRLVAVMPSGEDEVNAAAFSPLPVRDGRPFGAEPCIHASSSTLALGLLLLGGRQRVISCPRFHLPCSAVVHQGRF